MEKTGMRRGWIWFLTVLGTVSPLWAVLVDLRVVSVLAADAGSALEAVVEGPVLAGQGWKVAGPVSGLEPSLVLASGAPVSARSLLMPLFFRDPGRTPASDASAWM